MVVGNLEGGSQVSHSWASIVTDSHVLEVAMPSVLCKLHIMKYLNTRSFL